MLNSRTEVRINNYSSTERVLGRVCKHKVVAYVSILFLKSMKLLKRVVVVI